MKESMSEHELSYIERHTQHKQKLLGNLADDEEFQMVFDLIAEVRRSHERIKECTMFNRHYLNHFYGGDFNKFKADFAYLIE